MNKLINLLIISFLIQGCSLNKNSKFWTTSKIVEENNEVIYTDVFPKEEALKKEFNSNLKIKLTTKPENSTLVNNYFNNNKRLNFNGTLKKLSQFKFSKIENFNQYQPEISFFKKNIIFFDNKGSILNFDQNSKLVWKSNNY